MRNMFAAAVLAAVAMFSSTAHADQHSEYTANVQQRTQCYNMRNQLTDMVTQWSAAVYSQSADMGGPINPNVVNVARQNVQQRMMHLTWTMSDMASRTVVSSAECMATLTAEKDLIHGYLQSVLHTGNLPSDIGDR